jgi:hypothetical protein
MSEGLGEERKSGPEREFWARAKVWAKSEGLGEERRSGRRAKVWSASDQAKRLAPGPDLWGPSESEAGGAPRRSERECGR